MARLYSDEDFSRRVTEQLRKLGHDVLSVQDAGQMGREDELVLAFAVQSDRAVVTFNGWDFVRLHRENSHAGIIVCTRDNEIEHLANRIHAAITQQATLRGKLIRVYRYDWKVSE